MSASREDSTPTAPLPTPSSLSLTSDQLFRIRTYGPTSDSISTAMLTIPLLAAVPLPAQLSLVSMFRPTLLSASTATLKLALSTAPTTAPALACQDFILTLLRLSNAISVQLSIAQSVFQLIQRNAQLVWLELSSIT